MKRRRVLFWAIGGLVFLLVVLAVLPLFFKKDIQAAVDQAIAAQVDAQVYYDTESFSLSFFRDFPNLSVGMASFGIVGHPPFETDTLVSIKRFELSLNLWSLFGNPRVSKIQLDEPKLLVLVLEDGLANYDIAKSTADTVQTTEPSGESGDLSIDIQKWEINNGQLVYYDHSLPFYLRLSGLNHSGSGNFSLSRFELQTETRIAGLDVGYDGVTYLSNKRVEADVTLDMDMDAMQFEFKNNRFSVNDFGFGVDGSVAMPGDSLQMDISFGGRDIDMKSILSLIPGAYDKYLDGVDASGKVTFDGLVKGLYTEELMPGISFGLTINGGRIAASTAPAPIEDVDVDFGFDYPSSGLTAASVKLLFSSVIAGAANRLDLKINNLDNYQWDVSAMVDADLVQIAGLLPLKDDELRGKVKLDLTTKGQYADLEAGRYDLLPTSGNLSVSDFYYRGSALPQGFGLATLQVGLNPEKVELVQVNGHAGRTDFNVKGSLENYLAFIMEDSALLSGRLLHSSSLVDLDEWMTNQDETAEVADTTEVTALEIVRIPQYIDFVFSSTIDKMVYDGLDIENFRGQMVVKQGKLSLRESRFSLLGGSFNLAGSYDSQPEQPTFNFNFDIQELSISKAYAAFNPVKQLVPIADKMTGNFSTQIGVSGPLDQEMMPVMEAINGNGRVQIADASLKNVKVIQAISSAAKLGKPGRGEDLASLKDLNVAIQIKNGRVNFDPFEVRIAGNKAQVSGSHGVDGSLDYVVLMKVPTGTTGVAVNQALSALTGGREVVGEFVDLNLGIQGTQEEPKVKLLGGGSVANGDMKTSLSTGVKKEVTAQVDAIKTQVKDSARAVLDSAKNQAENVVEEQKADAKKKAEEEAKKALKNIFKKKK